MSAMLPIAKTPKPRSPSQQAYRPPKSEFNCYNNSDAYQRTSGHNDSTSPNPVRASSPFYEIGRENLSTRTGIANNRCPNGTAIPSQTSSKAVFFNRYYKNNPTIVQKNNSNSSSSQSSSSVSINTIIGTKLKTFASFLSTAEKQQQQNQQKQQSPSFQSSARSGSANDNNFRPMTKLSSMFSSNNYNSCFNENNDYQSTVNNGHVSKNCTSNFSNNQHQQYPVNNNEGRDAIQSATNSLTATRIPFSNREDISKCTVNRIFHKPPCNEPLTIVDNKIYKIQNNLPSNNVSTNGINQNSLSQITIKPIFTQYGKNRNEIIENENSSKKFIFSDINSNRVANNESNQNKNINTMLDTITSNESKPQYISCTLKNLNDPSLTSLTSMNSLTTTSSLGRNASFKVKTVSLSTEKLSIANSILPSQPTPEPKSLNNLESSKQFIQYKLTKECNRLAMSEDSDGYIQLNQYSLKNEIGKGSYGIVKLAYNKQDNRNYAIKMVSKKKLAKKSCLLKRAPSRQHSSSRSELNHPLERVYKEIAILKKIDHPNVVKLIEVLDDPHEDHLCLVFEFFEKGTVIEIPSDNPLSEELAWKYFRDLTLGVEYLHYQKIIHRDIKPSNLLLSDDNHIKIGDFGVSNEFDGDDAVISNTMGTPAFMPPESITDNSMPWLGKPMDIWAMGITLYSFLFGYCPFQDECILSLRNKILCKSVSFPEEPKLSSDLRDLILKLLTKDPSKRITIEKIKKHKWVTKNDTCPLVSENCKPITITDDDVKNCVKTLYKLDTLIFIKSMIKKRSFCNPFRSRNSSFSTINYDFCCNLPDGNENNSTSPSNTETII